MDSEAPSPVDLAAEAAVWLVRPDGPSAQKALARVRPSAADLSDAATWDGVVRGAERLRRRLLLRLHAADTMGVPADRVEVVREPGGRPRIAAPFSAYASVARRGAWAALAVAARPIGVDLEAPHEGEARPLLTAADAEAVRDMPGHGAATAFALGWATREAYLKATGAGLEGSQAVRLRREGGDLMADGPEGAAQAQWRYVAGLLAVATLL